MGVDAGGTKTAALVSDLAGHVAGAGKAGPGNFQAIGVELAKGQVKRAMDLALDAAGIGAGDLEAAFYGMAGAWPRTGVRGGAERLEAADEYT